MPQVKKQQEVDHERIVERRLAISEDPWNKLWVMAISPHRTKGDVVTELVEAAWRPWLIRERKRIAKEARECLPRK